MIGATVPLLAAACAGGVLAWWYGELGFDPGRPDHWRWLARWWWAHGALPPGMAAPLFAAATVLFGGVLAARRYAGRATARTLEGAHGNDTLHGSARWARRADIAAAGLLSQTGVVVGGWRRAGRTVTLRHDGPEHVLAFAPTRSGKGVGLVLPTLLSWPHSALVLDIKGENHALSAGWRASIGQRVLRFDPSATHGSHRFNPLAEIRLGSDREIADTQNVAAIIIDPDGKGLYDFWMKSGFAWLTAATLHVLYRVRDDTGRTASLVDVGRHLAAADDGGMEAMLAGMRDYDHGRPAVNDLVRQAARTMIDRAPAERSGVHSSALTELDLYRDPIVAANIAVSDFALADLMGGENPATLYLVVPPSDIDRLRPLLRVVLNLFLRRLTGETGVAADRPGHNHRLLLMLDEFAALGKLEIFERALAFMAGYDLKCFIIVQDIAQLRKAYGAEESIFSNCHIRIAHAPNRVETARMLSEMTGKTTVVQKKRARSHRALEWAGSLSDSLAATGRPLLTADECMQLPGLRAGRRAIAGDMLIFPAGFPPIHGRQALFFQDKVLAARARIAAPAPPAALAAARPPSYEDALKAAAAPTQEGE